MPALAELLKKKDAPGNLYKSTVENTLFFNCEQVCLVKKIVKISNKNYNYWISKEVEDKVIDKRLLRQELYALNDQFDWKMEPIFIYYDNLSFDQYTRFTMKLGNNDLLEGALFKKNKEYYITSMSCFVDPTVDVKKTTAIW